MFKKSFRNLADGTSIHGIADAYYAKSAFWVIMWSVIVASAFGLTTYQLYGVIKDYSAQPTNTIMLPANEDDILYPPLRLCYTMWMFWVDFNKATKVMNISKETILLALNYMNVIYSSETFDLKEAHANLSRVMKENNCTTVFEFYKAIAKDVPIAGENNLLGFGKMEIVYEYPTTLFCYTMTETQIYNYFRDNDNFLKSKWITFTTADIMYNDIERYVTMEEYNRYSKKWVTAKSMYKIMSEYNSVNYTEFAPPILIFPDAYNLKSVDIFTENDMYKINMQSSARVMKNKLKSPCVEDAKSTSINDTCMNRCVALKLNISCTCMTLDSAVALDEDRTENLCHYGITFVDKRGDHTASYQFETIQDRVCTDTDESQSAYDKCKTDCLTACTIWTYETTVSITKMMNFVRKIGKKDATNISIEYSLATSIIVMSEVDAQTWQNFVGSVGGVLGIWTGASVVSFIQFFYLCCCADNDELHLKGLFQKRKIPKTIMPLDTKDSVETKESVEAKNYSNIILNRYY